MPTTNIQGLKRVSGPIIFYNGSQDEVYNWKWVKKTLTRLKELKNVEIWREDVGHIDDGHWLSLFLSRVLPPPSVCQQIEAYDAFDGIIE